MRIVLLTLSLGLAACSSSPVSQYCATLATCAMEECELSPEACEELRQGEQDACEAELKATRDVIGIGGDAACTTCIEAMDRYYNCAADIATCTDFAQAATEDCDGEYVEYVEACTPQVQTDCGQTSGQTTGSSTTGTPTTGTPTTGTPTTGTITTGTTTTGTTTTGTTTTGTITTGTTTTGTTTTGTTTTGTTTTGTITTPTTGTTTIWTSTTGATTTSIESDWITGRTYLIRYADLIYTDPSLLMPTMATLGLEVEIEYIMMQVQEVVPLEETFLAVVATGSDEVGTPVVDCATAAATSPVDFSDNPSFLLGPESLVLPLSPTTSLTVEDFQMQGTFVASGDSFIDTGFEGAIDTRPLGVSCGLLAFLADGTCSACEDGALECLLVTAIAERALASDDVDIIADCGL
jgi:hypothetical protein